MEATHQNADLKYKGPFAAWPTWVPAICATAAMLVLAYPPVGLGWLAWIALTPFLVVLSSASTGKQAVTRGGVLAVLVSGGLLYFTWMINLATWPERIGATLALNAILVFQYGLFALGAWALLRWAVSENGRSGPMRQTAAVVLLAVLWFAVEWITQRLGYGLSAYLGLTQWQYPAIVRFARYVGLMGVSALVVGVNVAIRIVWRMLCRLWPIRRVWPANALRVTGIAVAFVMLATILIGARQGALRPAGVWTTGDLTSAVSYPFNTADDQASIDLVLVQNGFTLDEYAQAESSEVELQRLFDRLLDQSREGVRRVARQNPRPGSVLVLWPETVLHSPLMNHPDYAAKISAMTEDLGAWLVAGLPWTDGSLYYNSAILVDPTGQVAGMYSKTRPIPVAEGWASRGAGWQPVTVNGLAVGIGLCSELIDPLPARTLTRNGASILVFLSSLDHLGVSSAAGLQAAFAPFRAAETGRYVAQVGSVGLTLVAAPNGALLAAMPGRMPGNLVAQAPAMSGGTPYIRYGDWPAWAAVLVSLLTQLYVVRRRQGPS